MQRRAILALAASGVALGACSTFKKFTGQRNDKVLPGEREDVLAPDQYTAKNPDPTATPPADLPPADQSACDPADPSCVSTIDQEGAGAEGQ